MKTKIPYYLTIKGRINPLLCRYCGINTFKIDEYYMVKDSIWRIVNLDKLGHPVKGGMLCIGCVEEKLGRKLNRNDFIDAPVNDLNIPFAGGLGKRSVRLIDRLSNED